MNFISRLTWQATMGLVSALLYAVSTPTVSAAQDSGLVDDRSGRVIDPSSYRQNSRFLLFGEGDRASTGMRPTGNMQMYLTNTGIVDGADLNIQSQPRLFGCVLCAGGVNQWFDVSPSYGAPRSEWLRFVEQAPSLLKATGGGWSVSRNFPTLSQRELLASDLQFGILFSGAQSTTDGSCQDYSPPFNSGPQGNAFAPGLTLLAGSNCEATWPLVGGQPTFRGDHPVSLDVFGLSQAVLASDFNFEWWRVDSDFVDQSKFFGSFQTYGAYDDFNSAMIGRFGDVVPGGSGDPLDEGWPLALRTEFQGFVFGLPTVSNTLFWRAIIINETEKVYGVPLDYENLYVGYSIMPIRGQETTFYAEVWRGAILTSETPTGSNLCPGTVPPGTAVNVFDCNNPSQIDYGFQQGATGVLVLKSPIGDLRNALLTCSPSENAQRAAERAIPCTSDAFFDPTNPHAGDTITYNHFRMCGFGFCSEETYAASVDRQMFGNLASNADDVLNGRSTSDIAGGPLTVYGLFRNPNFPQQPTPFAAWVPSTWDYSANGVNPGGDTLWVSTCYGLPGQGRENRTDACSVTWSDTMPVGELGNPTYNNQEGNISHWSVGPFQLAAGDTTALFIAMVAGIDSAGFEAEVNNAIELYMNFFLSPEAPPVVSIVGAQVDVMNPSQDPSGLRGQVTLYWDDASDDFIDEFLDAFADNLEAAVAGDLLRIRTLNPNLVSDIRARARDNLARILVFKSCDGGQTFTASDTDGRGDIDCDGDPARDIDGGALGSGWQSYADIDVDASGNAPNSFVDQLVKAGQSYLYSILGETRGASFAIVDSVDTNSDGIFDAIAPDSLVLAPALMNPLSRSATDANVVSVYVPASIQAGGEIARIEFTEVDPGRSTVPFDIQLTGGDPTEAHYKAIFANEFEVVRAEQIEDDTTVVSWEVTARDLVLADTGGPAPATVPVATATFTTLNPNGVTLSGAALTGDTTTISGLGFVLVRDDTGEPLLISIVLDGQNTTDPDFFGRSDVINAFGEFTGFPGFVVTADNSNGGSFNRAIYRNSSGDSIPTQVVPTLAWNNQLAAPIQTGGVSAFGDYSISWVGQTFGPGAPFRLNKADPSVTDADFDASIEARAAGLVGRTDDAAAQAVSAALGSPITADQLVPVRAPFTIRNATFDRDVDIAMRARISNSILLGNIGSLRTGQTTRDTLSVTIAADAWAPGDQLFFLETVQLDSVVDVGGTPAVALDANGQPLTVEREVVTFAPAVLDCGQRPRPTCNPVSGAGSSQNWVTNTPGQTLNPQYFAPFDLTSQFAFDVRAAISGDEAIASGRDISAQLDSIKVVPNPYIVFSEYQVATPQANDARLMFTHLPPRGNLRIFTVSGRFVQELNWDTADLAGNGDLFWDMRTREGNNAGSGLYVFVVRARNPATSEMLSTIGKFVIIR